MSWPGRAQFETGKESPLRLTTLLRRFIISLSVLALVGGLLFFHFSRHYKSSTLSPAEMETVQATRYYAQTRRFGTQIIRPLETATLTANADGTLPDLNHQPFPTLVYGTLLRVLRRTGAGAGDREMVQLTMGFFALCLLACHLLARTLFGSRGSILSVYFFGLGGAALTYALSPQPILLATLLLTLLLLAFFRLDRIPSAGEEERPAPLLWAVLAGVLFGALYLTLYSTLLLLPILLYHLIRVSRRNWKIPALFLMTVFIVMAPFLLRAFRLTGNPLYHTRLVELMMRTQTYPEDALYRSTDLPLSIPQYLGAGGGIAEIAAKTGQNLHHIYSQAPAVLGVLVLPLFLGASLTRFTDNRINRLRGTVYALIGVHLLGLSLYLPPADCLPALLLYSPFAAALSASFLLGIIRARNLPRFFERTLIAGWSSLLCVPGILILFTTPTPQQDISPLYSYLNNDPRLQAVRSESNGLVVSDNPWELAFRCDVTTIWLPGDSGVMRRLEERIGLAIRVVTLSSSLPIDYRDDPGAEPWIQTQNNIFAATLAVATLPAPLNRQVLDRMQLFYPTAVSSVMNDFRPNPVPEADGKGQSVAFWRATPAGAGNAP